MKKLLLNSMLLLCALVVGSSSVWADDISLTASSGFGSSYGTDHTFTVSSIGFKDSGVMYNSKNAPTGFAVKQIIQMRKSSNGAGTIYNTSAISTITSVEVTLVNANNGFTLYYGTSESPSTNSIASSSLTPTTGTFSYTNTGGNSATATSYKFTFNLSSYNATYIKIVNGGSANYVGSIVINYTPSSTPTCVTPTFLPVAGTYKSAQSITMSTTTEGATIHYTTDGSNPTSSSTAYDPENKPFVSTTTTIKAIAVKEGSNNSSVASATYNIVTIEHAGTEADPYTVADARNAIDAIDGTKENVYVTGIVCTGGSDYGNNALNYWISDDGTETNKLEAYRGKNLNNTNFSANTDVKVGEIVTIKGTLTKFNSTYEFTSGNYLVDHKKKPATPTFSPTAGTYITAKDVTISCTTDGATIYYTTDGNTPTSSSTPYTAAIHLTVNATIKAISIKDGVSSDVATASYTISTDPFVTISDNAINATIEGANDKITVTYGNLTDLLTDVVFYESDGTTAATYDHSWLITDFDANNDLEYLIDENTVNVARTAYLKVYAVGNEGEAYSELITISQAAAPYVDLPFSWAGGTNSDLNAMVGVTTSGLGSDYAAGNAPYRIKMDTAGDYIQINTNTQPGKVSIGVKMIGGATTSKIKIQESADGTDFEDVEELEISGSTNDIVNLVMTNAFNATTRYVRIYKSVHANGGNIGVGPINIALPNEPAIPVADGSGNITLTTSDNMAGWRAFYDASNSYSVDANTKVYVADADPVESIITLKEIDGIPADVPVILHTSSSADSHKMTLTKETVTPFEYDGTNKLIWATTAQTNVYRLGYGASGVGFYPYSGTPASGAVILNVSSAAAGAREFLGFGDVTAIEAVKAQNAAKGEYFNLAGQRVAQPTKGLYIVNGHKVVIK